MKLIIDAKFQGKLSCAFKTEQRNLANFHRLQNCNFICGSKVAELNQHQNSNQSYRADAV